jgi:hypothetical protein
MKRLFQREWIVSPKSGKKTIHDALFKPQSPQLGFEIDCTKINSPGDFARRETQYREA